MGCKSSKDDDVSGSDTCTGVDGNQAFGGHGHIDNDPVGWLYPKLSPHRPRQVLDSFVELRVRDLASLNAEGCTC